MMRQLIKYLSLLTSFIISSFSLFTLSLPLLLIFIILVNIFIKNVFISNILVLTILIIPILIVIYKFIRITSENIDETLKKELIKKGEVLTNIHNSNDLQSERIKRLIKEASLKLDSKKDITIFRINANKFNAYALTNIRKQSAIVIYDGVLSLSDDYLLAIIGHEIGHINNNDTLLKLSNYAIQSSIPMFQKLSDDILLFIHKTTSQIPFVGLISSFYLISHRLSGYIINFVLKLNMYVVSFMNKQSEFIADKNGMRATSKETMIEVLKLISRLEDKSEKQTILEKMLNEHPDTSLRIKEIGK